MHAHEQGQQYVLRLLGMHAMLPSMHAVMRKEEIELGSSDTSA
jgi:hypothetical protein